MKSQKRVRGFKIALLIFLIILLLLALLIAVGYGYYRSKVKMLQPDQVIAPEDMILSQDEMDELVEDSHELADQMNQQLEALEEAAPIEAVGNVREEDQVINILFIGTDERARDFSENARGDSCMLFSVNTAGDHPVISLVSFERGMGVPVLSGEYEGRWDWLTHMFRYGGSELMLQTIQECFKLDVDYYVRVNFNSFTAGVDALGGVDVHMDRNEALYFINGHKYPAVVGMNHLDGEMALNYARLREIDSDWQRIERQREVVFSALTQLKGMSLTEADQLINTAITLVRTNLDEKTINKLLLMLPSLPKATFQQMTIPKQGTYGGMTGMGGRGMFAADFQTNTEILHEFIYGEYHEIP